MAKENSLVRVGKVSDVNSANHTARVYYPSMSNMVSDWLPVLKTSDSWMPRINDNVVVLMEFGFNSGGYILGVIQ